jgi:transposase-like protein
MSYEYLPIHTYEQQLGTEPEPTRTPTSTIPAILKWGLAIGAGALIFHHLRMRRNPDDEDVLDLLIRYKQAGVDVSELLESFGVSGEALEEQVGLSGFVPVPAAIEPSRRRRISAVSSVPASSEWIRSKDKKEAIIRLYKPGMNLSKLCRKVGVNTSTATKWLKKAGVYEAAPRGQMYHEEKEALINAYKPGMNVYKLAREFGVTSSTANRWLKDAGVYERIDPLEYAKKEVLDIYEPGMRKEDLARRYGVTRSCIYNWLKEAGRLKRTRMADDPLRKKVISIYVPGMRITDLAKKFNLHQGTVRNWLKEAGVYVPGKQGRPKKKR